ncbi:hypothetical protein KKC1_13500, partial [Calderihabitans maritimus]
LSPAENWQPGLEGSPSPLSGGRGSSS